MEERINGSDSVSRLTCAKSCLEKTLNGITGRCHVILASNSPTELTSRRELHKVTSTGEFNLDLSLSLAFKLAKGLKAAVYIISAGCLTMSKETLRQLKVSLGGTPPTPISAFMLGNDVKGNIILQTLCEKTSGVFSSNIHALPTVVKHCLPDREINDSVLDFLVHLNLCLSGLRPMFREMLQETEKFAENLPENNQFSAKITDAINQYNTWGYAYLWSLESFFKQGIYTESENWRFH